eukprot:scaffold44253_cov81-Phaeocystis_antarctica.AAC.1
MLPGATAGTSPRPPPAYGARASSRTLPTTAPFLYHHCTRRRYAWRSVGVALHFLVVALETRYRRPEDGDVRLVLAVADICAAVIHSRGAVLLYRMLASHRAKAGVEESDRLGGALGETDKRKTLDVPRRLGNIPGVKASAATPYRAKEHLCRSALDSTQMPAAVPVGCPLVRLSLQRGCYGLRYSGCR